MAKKNKPYATFETKEQFDKTLDDMFESGREKGFNEGIEYCLSYLLEILDKMGTKHTMNAEYVLGQRRRQEFKQRQDLYDGIKKQAIEEYIKSWQSQTEES